MEDLVELGLRKPAAAGTATLDGDSAPPRASSTATTTSASTVATGPGAANDAWLGLIDRLLQLMATVAPESEPGETDRFRTAIAEHRRQLAIATGRDRARLTDACLKACDAYLRGARDYVTRRESELLEIIGLLRQAATQMVGDSSDFNSQVLETSERFMTLARFEDILELRHHLSAEVAMLRRAVVAKQRRDETMLSQLSDRVEQLQSNLQRAEEEASLDALTRVSNRGHFDRTLRRCVEKARRTRASLVIAMLDVDNFKVINDSYGHQVGDRVILCTAQWLQRVVRKSDCVARYGGEEFGLILPDTRADEVEQRMAKLLADIAGSSYDYEEDGQARSIRFTASVGITEFDHRDADEDLVRRADEALYDAKRKGKNRVIVKKRSVFGRLFHG